MVGRNSARILLVEDENLLRSLVAQFLRAEGHEVLEAADGLEAVELFSSSRPFDVVLLDLNLPGLPGVAVCERIRRLQPDQEVLICSAAILDDHRAALDALQVDQYLSKPYHPAELLRCISLLRQRSGAAVPVSDPSDMPRARRLHAGHARSLCSRALFNQPAID
jgi:DNA-binding response OmpR family regulator